MKNRTHFNTIMALAAMAWYGQIVPVLVAQDSGPAPASKTAPVQLSVGVWDVLRLSQAKVSDGIITAYIKNSGKVYSLGASEILYLREQGLSDPVLTAMLNQRKNMSVSTEQAPPPPTPIAQPSVWANSSSPQYVPPADPPAPTYVQSAPVYVQPSPVYVYPGSSYYSAWPCYGGYWGLPALSLSFGFGRGHYGGYHGGGFSSGGHHGGGGHR